MINVYSKEIDTLQKNWDRSEDDVEKLRSALSVVCQLLTTNLEGDHTHAQRNGMVILIREHANRALRETENDLRIDHKVKFRINDGLEDIAF